MRKINIALIATVVSGVSMAQYLDVMSSNINSPIEEKPTPMSDKMQITGGYFSGNKRTGELTATGGVTAASLPFLYKSDSLTRDMFGTVRFGKDAVTTTCTNDFDHLHWKLKGTFSYAEDSSKMMTNSYLHLVAGGPVNEGKRAMLIQDAWVYLYDIPVMWIPYWYYPMDTNYGYRVLPGYTSRWGAYLKTGYVYNIMNEGLDDKVGFGGSTYLDLRTKNGIAVGQTIRWHLRNWGHGKFKVYHAWDDDYDRYERHWTRDNSDRNFNYHNWSSEVNRERYRLLLEHYGDITPRDTLRVHGSYLSDSYFLYDFFRGDERYESVPYNEISYEHREDDWSSGVSISGPLNEFYGGTARLPEWWIAVNPMPVFDLPLTYESQTRAGFLNRDYAQISKDADWGFRYTPFIGPDGKGASYQAFRFDSSHRVAAPFKVADVLSLVPRATYRGTYWSDSGDMSKLADGLTRASGDALYRNIAEVGITASSRASAWITENWKHTFEPYIDYSYQYVETSSARGKRAYIFDSYDGVTDWLEQFGFEGRSLPYNWHGVRPGFRNYFQEKDENGVVRTVADFDVYAAIPFESYKHYGRNANINDYSIYGYSKDNDDLRYGETGDVYPGIRARVSPWRNVMLASRVEYDVQNDNVAYADFVMKHNIFESFSYTIGYIGRDHRIWDYLPYTVHDRWNWEKTSIVHVGFEHKILENLIWAPYLRYDCRLSDVEECGVWFDILTDCIGFRTSIVYESDYVRIDGSKQSNDFSVAFYIYLRAFGSAGAFDLVNF